MRRLLAARATLAPLALAAALGAGEPPFRTDADGPVGAKLEGKDGAPPPQWHQLVEGRFPPEGSAHAVSGELMRVDHLERRFQIRVDRNDSQDRGFWDLPLDAAMLPYGAIYYHGAPAALQDLPLGTRLHGLFYLQDPDDDAPLPDGPNHRQTPEWEFRRCFRLEDDFTHRARQNQLWRLDAVDLEAMKLTATLLAGGEAAGDAKVFDLLSHTGVFQGQAIVGLEALKPGQEALFNLTWATLYGPGRITEIWLDEPSRGLATARQLDRHRNHVRERGLAGWIDAVDDEEETVTLTFFGGVDGSLLDEWQNDEVTSGGLAVARESLMTYDPVNDRKSGSILGIERIPAEPGSSGVRLTLKMAMMLEGYRPRRVVRFYPSAWSVIALPREEQFHARE